MPTAPASSHELDLVKAQAFAMKVLGDTTSLMVGTLHLIGDRLRLFEALAATGPATADGFAERTDIHHRYAREWLSAMACHGYVSYDDDTEQFSMAPEQAACLVVQDSPLYLGGLVRMQPDFWRNVDTLTDAFQDGGGVSQDRFGGEWCCGLERFTRPAFANNLCRDWISALAGIDERLRAGGSAADVGCGNGQALIELARAYRRRRWPASTSTPRRSRRPGRTPRRRVWGTGSGSRPSTSLGASQAPTT